MKKNEFDIAARFRQIVRVNSTSETDTDVLILGGGLAGLTLALQLRKTCPACTVTVLEQRRHPVPEAAFKVGESSVEIGAHYFADVVGMRSHLEKSQLPKLGLRYFFDSAPEGSDFSGRSEFGGTCFLPAGSFQIDRGRFENHLGEVCLQSGVNLRLGARVRTVETDSDSGHTVIYRGADKTETRCRSRWLIDASGRAGMLRHQFGLGLETPHRCSSVWFRVAERIKVDDWSDNPDWHGAVGGEHRRWLSTNHLMGEGYWVWLIPLASGSTSVGIVADESFHPSDNFYPFDRTLAWLDANEPLCGRVIRALRDKVQDVLIERDFSYDCRTVFSNRIALTGEAGLFLDPFYSPGSDFIAMSNTFIADLIRQDMDGRSVSGISSLYDDVYHQFFYNTLNVYHRQYPLFGNALVMPFKVVWDLAYYWAIPASLFFHGRLCDVQLYQTYRDLFAKIGRINASLQELFRIWHEQAPNPHLPYHFVNVPEIPFMRDLNSHLVREISDADFIGVLEKHAALLEQLAGEIAGHAHENGLPRPSPGILAEFEEYDDFLLTPMLDMINGSHY